MIISVALKRDELIYSLPKPARHHDVIKAMVEAGIAETIDSSFEQGFLTVKGFMNRVEAAKFVGQSTKLFSEDLW